MALSSYIKIEVALLVIVIWMLFLIVPLPLGVVSILSPDASNIRTVWTPNTERATLALYPFRMFEPLLKTVATFFVFLVVLLSSRGSNRIFVPGVIILTAVVQGGMAIYSVITGEQFMDARLFDGHSAFGRGTFVNKNLFAAYMWFPLCFAIANIWERWLSSKRLMLTDSTGWVVLLAFSAIAMAMSYSSGALTVAIILVITIVATFRLDPLISIRRFGIPVLVCFIIGICILVFQPGNKDWYTNVFQYRADIWRESVKLFEFYWLTGLGGDGIEEMFDVVREWSVGDYRFNTLHTYVLDQWMKFGLVYVLGVAFLWYQIYGKFIAGGSSNHWRLLSPTERVFIRYTVILGYCLLLHSVISPVFYYICIHFGFICILAAACKIMLEVKTRENKEIKVVL